MFSKKILISALVSLSAGCAVSSVFASGFIQDAGPYVGAQGGLARAYYGNDFKNTVEKFPTHDVTEGGFGGRLYAGWSFNPYLGIEGGYTQFANNKYSASASYDDGFGDSISVSGDGKVKTNAWDVVGKVSLPFGSFNPALSGLSVYAKGGAAYVTADASGDVTASETIFGVTSTASQNFSGTAHDWEPVVGAGIAYTFANNLGLDVSFTHTQGHNSSVNLQDGTVTVKAPSTNLAAIGVSYKFNLLNSTSAS
jgi:opacity protein-like surface antigen